MNVTESLQQEITQASKDYLQDPQVPVLPLSGYQNYLSKGERLPFENSYFERRRQLIVLALDFFLHEKEATKTQLEQVIWEVCNEYTWALPAHLPIENKLFTQESVHCIDLFAAETGQALSEILEIIGKQLSPLIQQRVYAEINQRIFVPLENKGWGWETNENNWSAVIAGSIGMTALSLLPKEDSRQLQIIKRLDKSFQSYLRGFGEDGACVEGVAYWAYGFGYYIYYAQKLAETLGDTTYLDIPKVKKIAAFPYHAMTIEDNFLPFSDYQTSELPSGLLSFIADKFEVPVPAVKKANSLEFDHCYRFAHVYRNLIWTREVTTPKNDVSYYFEDAQWAILRSEEKEVVFAAKGGRNDESHNHIDLGHFIFGDKNHLYLTDLGSGEYTRDYFNDNLRYNYLVTNAKGHSIPVINGKLQESGDVCAKKASFTSSVDGEIFQLDLSDVYPDSSNLQSFNRELLVNKEKRELTLSDHFTFDQSDNEVIETFVTSDLVTIEENQAIIGENESCKMQFETTNLSVEEVSYSGHDGNTYFAHLIYATYKLAEKNTVKLTIQL
ncbi:MAG TPA: heparinase II/III-family protein [Candidatus Tetragenococcus pullicola]|nr:heparinase II/III-family protein [Candidatus Tetragenococcus pullicola]